MKLFYCTNEIKTNIFLSIFVFFFLFFQRSYKFVADILGNLGLSSYVYESDAIEGKSIDKQYIANHKHIN